MQKTLSAKTKVSYGIGDLGLALTGAMLGLLFAKFLTDTVGLRPSLVAVAIFIGRTWDWVNDPIQGYISDHIRTRWGRRRPFLLFGAVPFAVAFALLWWIPPIHSEIGLLIYYTAAYFLFDTMVTLIFIPYVALTPEITTDYDERTSLTSTRMFFSLLGSLLGTVVPLLVLGGATIRPEKSGAIFGVGLVLAIVAAVPFLITFAGTKERVEYQQQEKPKLAQLFRAMLANRPYLSAVAIYLVTVSGFEVITGTSLYFIEYKIRLPEIADYTTLTMFVAALCAIPLWVWVSKKLNKVKAYAAAVFYLIIVLVIYGSLASGVSPVLVFLVSGLAGIGIAAGQTLPWAILPDTVEYGEYLTGQRHEGIYYSLMTLARKIASSITLPMVLLLLDWSGYVRNTPVQSPQVTRMIGLIFAGFPAILFSIGIVTALRFPLGRERFAEIREILAARRQQPEHSLTGELSQDKPHQNSFTRPGT